LWAAEEIGRVLQAILAAYPNVASALEVTVECNPSSLDAAVARSLRQAGVNRLSIGVQALDDARLRFLGRLHDADGALRAVQGALAQVPRVSGDLIFGLPGQSPERAAQEAKQLLACGLSHLSVYALTIESGTQFGQLHRKGKLPMAAEDDVADAFLRIEQALACEGLEHYEVSNYARIGERGRHNEHYWRGGAYLGLGAGAVGCMHHAPGHGRRYRNNPAPEHYLVHSGTPGVEIFEEALGPQDLLRERLMLGLRTSDGMDLAAARAAIDVDPLQGRERALAQALERGDVIHQADTLRIPHARWLHLDSIVARLF
jgi:oxygen-independent coproporphyrinogen-3 oxidase